ncbi:similar to Saccharomyces cerevisiae YNL181W Putative oxidoreductase [Maudiozyma barnettii]|uniref:Similar to Saccharomyces cerevisiae YNL181W Putative oxidoreductase n=1 Tax=Maudiozyma barnettii TaxID=61262 RepID=A0A8H2VE49_9SACH|nr:putative oxidoreductase [Kazachstania barnettii]CAB4253890.1 similar to Saccharomyces cerevisiae YNL181W Putative oxidoreductase [Kazachstania barnettii]CAD1781640.1 similar to Saccharomyces cerevisiae YNL181W Putative oxidoreductase [Kazachstania barnettii]
MPLNILGTALLDGTDNIPYYNVIKKVVPYVTATAAVKYWSRGPSNTWERQLHGKVYIVTGATSQGMGTSVAFEMAKLGAQLIFLTRSVDEWSTDWVEDMRDATGNELLYMEQCDMADLYQIRQFATRWLNNSPPRRLDGVIIMSGDMEPIGIPHFSKPVRQSSVDGLERQIAVNYAGVFHLMDLLQPSFKAQPPDRDVRIIISTCWTQVMGEINVEDPLWQSQKYKSPLKFFSSSKLQLGLTMMELQRRLIEDIKKVAKEKKDTERSGLNIKVVLVQPGTMRSNSLRRVVSNGSVIILLVLYCVILYPFLWLLTKSGNRGAQNILYALNTPEFEEVNLKDTNAKYVSDCSVVKFARKEFEDSDLQKQLYDNTRRDILALEKKMAVIRNSKKKTEEKSKK